MRRFSLVKKNTLPSIFMDILPERQNNSFYLGGRRSMEFNSSIINNTSSSSIQTSKRHTTDKFREQHFEDKVAPNKPTHTVFTEHSVAATHIDNAEKLRDKIGNFPNYKKEENDMGSLEQIKFLNGNIIYEYKPNMSKSSPLRASRVKQSVDEESGNIQSMKLAFKLTQSGYQVSHMEQVKFQPWIMSK